MGGFVGLADTDTMTDAELLTQIETAIAGNTDGVIESKINGRELRFMSLTELLALRDKLQARIQRSRHGMFSAGRPMSPPTL